jgi:hypothetical protein
MPRLSKENADSTVLLCVPSGIALLAFRVIGESVSRKWLCELAEHIDRGAIGHQVRIAHDVLKKNPPQM